MVAEANFGAAPKAPAALVASTEEESYHRAQSRDGRVRGLSSTLSHAVQKTATSATEATVRRAEAAEREWRSVALLTEELMNTVASLDVAARAQGRHQPGSFGYTAQSGNGASIGSLTVMEAELAGDKHALDSLERIAPGWPPGSAIQKSLMEIKSAAKQHVREAEDYTHEVRAILKRMVHDNLFMADFHRRIRKYRSTHHSGELVGSVVMMKRLYELVSKSVKARGKLAFAICGGSNVAKVLVRSLLKGLIPTPKRTDKAAMFPQSTAEGLTPTPKKTNNKAAVLTHSTAEDVATTPPTSKTELVHKTTAEGAVTTTSPRGAKGAVTTTSPPGAKVAVTTKSPAGAKDVATTPPTSKAELVHKTTAKDVAITPPTSKAELVHNTTAEAHAMFHHEDRHHKNDSSRDKEQLHQDQHHKNDSSRDKEQLHQDQHHKNDSSRDKEQLHQAHAMLHHEDQHHKNESSRDKEQLHQAHTMFVRDDQHHASESSHEKEPVPTPQKRQQPHQDRHHETDGSHYKEQPHQAPSLFPWQGLDLTRDINDKVLAHDMFGHGDQDHENSTNNDKEHLQQANALIHGDEKTNTDDSIKNKNESHEAHPLIHREEKTNTDDSIKNKNESHEAHPLIHRDEKTNTDDSIKNKNESHEEALKPTAWPPIGSTGKGSGMTRTMQGIARGKGRNNLEDKACIKKTKQRKTRKIQNEQGARHDKRPGKQADALILDAEEYEAESKAQMDFDRQMEVFSSDPAASALGDQNLGMLNSMEQDNEVLEQMNKMAASASFAMSQPDQLEPFNSMDMAIPRPEWGPSPDLASLANVEHVEDQMHAGMDGTTPTSLLEFALTNLPQRGYHPPEQVNRHQAAQGLNDHGHGLPKMLEMLKGIVALSFGEATRLSKLIRGLRRGIREQEERITNAGKRILSFSALKQNDEISAGKHRTFVASLISELSEISKTEHKASALLTRLKVETLTMLRDEENHGSVFEKHHSVKAKAQAVEENHGSVFRKHHSVKAKAQAVEENHGSVFRKHHSVKAKAQAPVGHVASLVKPNSSRLSRSAFRRSCGRTHLRSNLLAVRARREAAWARKAMKVAVAHIRNIVEDNTSAPEDVLRKFRNTLHDLEKPPPRLRRWHEPYLEQTQHQQRQQW
eukprot:TRINITY_DN5000_c0_g1_i4.p1 TRINITY_DN5000_c0_g1~~TRINITY_DN5000_c0_g1_i4.p1  ORF type:complete len:1229 (+),score=207.93 TRINITY_DN5000_c0_g1_i4:271-3687(+)